MVQIIKYFFIFIVGLISGYFIYSSIQENEQSDGLIIEQAENIQPIQQPTLTELTETQKTGQLELTNNDLSLLNQQIEQQQQLIKKLQQNLIEQQNINRELLVTKEESTTSLEAISLEDFEKQIKDQFVNKFKGYAIELKGEQLTRVKESLEKDATKAEWNAEYENNITAFISDSDPNGLHFVDEMSCNQSMCRLKVQSNDTEHWKKLYHQMTNQSWYNSITLTEPSSDPSIFIYYIPQPQDS